MWIWIGIGIWLLCGMVGYFLVRNAWSIKYSWDKGDVVFLSIWCPVMGVIGLLVILITNGKDCFKKKSRRKKMEKIYWDENEQQIKTKAGECLYDRRKNVGTDSALIEAIRRIDDIDRRDAKSDKGNAASSLGQIHNLMSKVANLENDLASAQPNAKLQAQLQCAAKTQGKHKMVFKRKGTATGYITLGIGEAQMRFIFKCDICGLEIIKSKSELTASEKEGLKKLGLL